MKLYCDEFMFRRNEKFFKAQRGTKAEVAAKVSRMFRMVCVCVCVCCVCWVSGGTGETDKGGRAGGQG
jgi:streptolysin S family bacteriocin protoxin